MTEKFAWRRLLLTKCTLELYLSAGATPRTLDHEVLLRSFAINNLVPTETPNYPTTVPIILPSPPPCSDT